MNIGNFYDNLRYRYALSRCFIKLSCSRAYVKYEVLLRFIRTLIRRFKLEVIAEVMGGNLATYKTLSFGARRFCRASIPVLPVSLRRSLAL